MKEELDLLKNKTRKELAERLRSAIAQGDLSENFDYADAKEQQAYVEGRILEIEDILRDTEVLEGAPKGEGVQIGSRVTLKDGNEEIAYTITGPQEADPLTGNLSAESPIGRALIGRKKGEKVVVETPGGKAAYVIAEIK